MKRYFAIYLGSGVIIGIVLTLLTISQFSNQATIKKMTDSFSQLSERFSSLKASQDNEVDQVAKIQQRVESIMDSNYLFFSRLSVSILPVPKKYRKSFISACDRWKVPYAVLYMIVEVETQFTPGVENKNTNGTVDRYLTQINSSWENRFINLYWDKEQKFNGQKPEDAFYLSCAILSDYHRKMGSWSRAVMAYNRGECSEITKGETVSTEYLERAQASLAKFANLVLDYQD